MTGDVDARIIPADGHVAPVRHEFGLAPVGMEAYCHDLVAAIIDDDVPAISALTATRPATWLDNVVIHNGHLNAVGVAAYFARVNGFNYLVRSRGASVSITEHRHMATPLFLAVVGGGGGGAGDGARLAIIRTILDSPECADVVDRPNSKGCTPLTVAAGLGLERVVRLLLSAGADCGREDWMGREPADHALEQAPEFKRRMKLQEDGKWPAGHAALVRGLDASEMTFVGIYCLLKYK